MADIIQILQDGFVWLWNNLIVGLIFAILILIIGYIVAKVVKWIVVKGLRRVRVDSYFRDTGLLESLRSVGFAGIPEILGLLVFWFIFLFFVALALTYLQFEQIGAFVTLIIEYLPRIMGAVLIVLAGLWMGTWASSRVKEPAEEADLPITTETVGSIVKWLIVFIAVVLALGLLGVDTTILVTTFTILIAAIAAALAISFGLGGRDTAANVSAYAAVSRMVRVGDDVTIGDYSGTILLVGRYGIVIKTPKGDRVTLSNTAVMDSVIVKKSP
ncbi:MAG: mechanosensitive ion channel [Methanobacteriota archaeon]|nr:MAG: mechanosensitive ion channel [Euryarchaeota archaeon]